MSKKIEVNRAIKEVNDGSIVIEVGAHVGDTVRLLQHKGAKVFAIEPDKRNFKKLKAMCDKSYNLLIGKSNDGIANLYSFKRADRCNTLFEKVQKTKEEKAEVTKMRTMTLDKFIEEHMCAFGGDGPMRPLITLIRFDCYGSEYEIFKGPTNFLEVTKNILITMHNKPPFDKYKKERKFITTLLKAAGFNLVVGDPLTSKKHIHQFWSKTCMY